MLDAFRDAEALLGTDKLETAAAGLPPRLGCLLRGIDALQRGEPQGVRTAAEQATSLGAHDVAAVLTLAITPRQDIDPTALRKLAKKQGLGDLSAVAFLDLYRMFAAALVGKRSSMAPGIRALRDTHEVVYAMASATTAAESTMYLFTSLHKVFPRPAELLTVAGALLRGRALPGVAQLREYYGDLSVSFEPDEWVGDSRATEVRRRLTDGGWVDGDDALAQWLYRRPRAEKREWLGAIVRALPALSKKDLHGTAAIAKIGSRLATELRVRDLAVQLTAVEHQLYWAGYPEFADTLEACQLVWSRRHEIAPLQRAELAESMLDCVEQVSPEEAVMAFATVAAHHRDLDAVVPATRVLSGVTSTDNFLAMMGNATQERQVLALALHHAAQRRFSSAFESIGDADTRQLAALMSMVAMVVEERAPSGRARRSVVGGVEAFAQRDLDLAQAHTLVRLVRATRASPPGLMSAIRSCLADQTRVGQGIALAIAIAQPELATDALRKLGRSLRRAGPSGDPHALRVLSAVFLLVEDEAVDVMRSLTAYATREGVEEALSTVQTMALSQEETEGIASWFMCALADEQGEWEDWVIDLCLASGDDIVFGDMLRPAVAGLLPGCRSIDELQDRLTSRARTMLEMFDVFGSGEDDLYGETFYPEF